jgi:dihydrofolate synthase/folylpolyglutamate synthase
VKTNQSTFIYSLNYEGHKFEINLPGKRGAENIMTAMTAFEVLGFNPIEFLPCLNKIRWNGRMQKLFLKNFVCPVYLSGDHNPQGFASLVELLNEMKFSELHLVIGIGADKDAETIFSEINQLNSPYYLYLTQTPFKGRKINQYPDQMLAAAKSANEDYKKILSEIVANCKQDDICVISGSLYLVGEVLKDNLSQ